MSIESPATPVAPSARAINAITKNVSAQLNMMHLPFVTRLTLARRPSRRWAGWLREQVVLMYHDKLVAIGVPKNRRRCLAAASAANPGFLQNYSRQYVAGA
jgi:hypothetical protein